MPLPQHCIDCDKVAVIVEDGTYYCAHCYMEIDETSKKSIRRGGRLSKRKLKS